MLWTACRNRPCAPIRRWGMCESASMNQASVLDWLGIDVWQLREPRSVPQPLQSESVESTTTSPLLAPQPEVARPDTTDTQPLLESVPDAAARSEPVPHPPTHPSLAVTASFSTLTICVPSGATTHLLFARIAQTVPRSVTVVTESTEITGSARIRWQGREWPLHDLQQDPGLKRRLWRTLCLPPSSAAD